MKKLKFSILFALLLSSLSTVVGQSSVGEIPNNLSDTSIVRYWQEGINIVYSYHWQSGEKFFLMVDENSPIVRRIAVPKEMTVNDFRILGDWVYFGGHHKDGTGYVQGLLACFEINDFYNGSGNYHWEVMLRTSMPDCYGGACTNQVCDIVRLAVFDDVQAGPQIAYICKNYIVGETTIRVGIGWATYNSISWYNNIIYNKYATVAAADDDDLAASFRYDTKTQEEARRNKLMGYSGDKAFVVEEVEKATVCLDESKTQKTGKQL